MGTGALAAALAPSTLAGVVMWPGVFRQHPSGWDDPFQEEKGTNDGAVLDMVVTMSCCPLQCPPVWHVGPRWWKTGQQSRAGYGREEEAASAQG